MEHEPDPTVQTPAPEPEQASPGSILALAVALDDAHHAQATLHLSDVSIAQAGIRPPTIRPEVDGHGAHTGKRLTV
jgi:hypothetical protein